MRQFEYAKFYDRFAPWYAPAMRLFPMWQRYGGAALPWLPQQGATLEIGPGPGVLLEQIAARSAQAHGLDLSAGMLAQAQRRLREAGYRPRLVRGDAQALPFADGSFAGVVATFAFSALPEGERAMGEMARVLAPGGIVALVDACEPSSGNRVALWLAQQWKKFGDFMRDEAAVMRTVGLEVLERREFGAFQSIRLTVGVKRS